MRRSQIVPLRSTLTDRLSKEAIRERRVQRRDTAEAAQVLEARDITYTYFMIPYTSAKNNLTNFVLGALNNIKHSSQSISSMPLFSPENSWLLIYADARHLTLPE